MQKSNLKIVTAICILTLFFVVMWHFAYKKNLPASQNWITYTNEKYGYTVQYPDNWIVREFPQTVNGAAFRPQSRPLDQNYVAEGVSIMESGRALQDCDMPFEDYVKLAGIHEIQDYSKLNSIEVVHTNSLLLGYKTTWVIHHGKDKEISLPITYFKDSSKSCNNGEGIVQITLRRVEDAEVYDAMIKKFDWKDNAGQLPLDITPADQYPTDSVSGDKDNLITFSIRPNEAVSGKVTVQGVVQGGYFFEANIILNVLDKNKKPLLMSHGNATDDWMSSGPVGFYGELDFTNLAKGVAYIEIHNDNASGLPQNDKSILIPIIIK